MTGRRRTGPHSKPRPSHLRLVRRAPSAERTLIVESLPLWITTLEAAGIEEVTVDLESLRWLSGIGDGNPVPTGE